MASPKTLLEALESIAYDKDVDDVLSSINTIRAALAFDTTDLVTRKKKDLWHVQAIAQGLLSEASKMAKKSRSRNPLLRMAAARMGQMKAYGMKTLSCHFAVKAVRPKDRRAKPRLEIVSPVDASPDFLVAYAFWVVASALPVTAWIRGKRIACPVCKRVFYRERRPGRPRVYCTDACHESRERKR